MPFNTTIDHDDHSRTAPRRRLGLAQCLRATGIASVVAASVGVHPSPATARQSGPCTVATLRGEFGLAASGVRSVPFGPDAGKTELIVGTGMRSYDGAGRFTETAAHLHGQLTGVTLDRGGIGGVYEVYPDCTGKSTRYVPGVPIAIISSFVIVDSGNSVKESVMDPAPNVITVLLDRR